MLFHRGDPFPLRYLDLGETPRASTRDYDRNAAIDSAPAANLVVTGQQESGGINVYRFDAAAQTLERIGAPTP